MNVYEKYITDSIFSDIVKKDESIRTQKAKGVFFLANQEQKIKELNLLVNPHFLFDADVSFDEFDFNWPVFIRPCPMVPRHGFVDSVICGGYLEANEVAAKTLEIEPDAEILVARPIDSAHNYILSGSLLTIGQSNDGATSGKNCKYLYLNADPITPLISLEPSLIGNGEIPFYEFVKEVNTNNIYLVQARSAPGIGFLKDYVPEDIIVKNVIDTEGDLVEWETKCKNLPEGTAVNHLDGSPASHYFIHCVINKIPILTTRVPVIGETLKKTIETKEVTNEDLEIFKRSFNLGFKVVSQLITDQHKAPLDLKNIFILSLSVLHNYAGLTCYKDYRLLGLVLGIFCRAALIISIGEFRYSTNNTLLSKDREINYLNSCQSSINEFIKYVRLAAWSFNYEKWESSFGGKKWANCTESVIEIYNDCINLRIDKAVSKFNGVINLVHNGGFYLNKVISKDYFDNAAKDSSSFLIKNLATITNLIEKIYSFSDSIDLNNNLSLIVMDPKYNSYSTAYDIIINEKEIDNVCIKTEKISSELDISEDLVMEIISESEVILTQNSNKWHFVRATSKVLFSYIDNMLSPSKKKVILKSKPYYYYINDQQNTFISKNLLNKIFKNDKNYAKEVTEKSDSTPIKEDNEWTKIVTNNSDTKLDGTIFNSGNYVFSKESGSVFPLQFLNKDFSKEALKETNKLQNKSVTPSLLSLLNNPNKILLNNPNKKIVGSKDMLYANFLNEIIDSFKNDEEKDK